MRVGPQSWARPHAGAGSTDTTTEARSARGVNTATTWPSNSDPNVNAYPVTHKHHQARGCRRLDDPDERRD
jgi:hypothetical protein